MATLAEQIARLQERQEQEIIKEYASTTTPVRDILAAHDISYNKLYRILRDARVPLRQPQRSQIVVLDPNNGNAPTIVNRNDATLTLRRRQIQDAYYSHQEVVTHICSTFHISWRTLYRICRPNRREFSSTGTSLENVPSTLENDSL